MQVQPPQMEMFAGFFLLRGVFFSSGDDPASFADDIVFVLFVAMKGTQKSLGRVDLPEVQGSLTKDP